MARPLSTEDVDLRNAESKYKDMCKRFRGVRIKHQLTQDEFAVMLELSPSTVKQIEYGGSAPSYETLRKLRERFKVSYDFMIDGRK